MHGLDMLRWRSLGVVVWCAAACAWADSERRVGADLYIGGGSVTVDDAVGGDLFAAGGTVDVDAPVTGDAVVAGGKVRLGAAVGQSVYAAGGQVDIHGQVGRNLRVAGGRLVLGPRSDVAGNVSVAGGQLRLQGTVKGHVQAAGGRVRIDGPVGGDVIATSGHVELGPQARIAGKLRYRSGDALQQDPAAQVSGGIELLAPGWGGPETTASAPAPAATAPTQGFGWLGWFWTAGLIVVAALWLGLAPRTSARSSQALRERPGWSLGLGFVWLVCVPVAALLLVLTIIGIPLALFALAVYLAVLPLAYVAGAVGLGDWALHRWQAVRASSVRWRIAAAAATLLLVTWLGHLPWLGAVLGLLLLLAGLGGLLLLWQRPAAVPAA
jgi:hypothetical protein